jgi:hypothetical protein
MNKLQVTSSQPGEICLAYDTLSNTNEPCNLYIISTPNQILSAIEAQHHFQTRNNVLLVLFNESETILEWSDLFPYDRIILYRKKNWRSQIHLFKVLKKNKYNYCFVGYSGDFQRQIISNISYQHLYLIDSSGETINTMIRFTCKHATTPPQQLSKPPKKQTWKNAVKALIEKVYGVTNIPSLLSDLNYFTVFPLRPCKNKVIIVRHTYSHLKNTIAHNEERLKALRNLIYQKQAESMYRLLRENNLYDIPKDYKNLLSPFGEQYDISFQMQWSFEDYKHTCNNITSQKPKKQTASQEDTDYSFKPHAIRYYADMFPRVSAKVFFDYIDDSTPANLFVVSVQSQMMSAIEAQHHFQTKNNVLVIAMANVKNGEKFNRIMQLSRHFPYDKLIILRYEKETGYLPMPQFLELLKHHKYNFSFFGYFTPWFRRMMANIDCKQLWLLDDGTYTLAIHEHVLSVTQKRDSVLRLTYDQDKNGDAIYQQLGIQTDHNLHDLNFFTLFNISPINKTVYHQYRYLHSLFASNFQKINDDVLIIGQPHRGLRLSVEHYLNYFEVLRQSFPHQTIRYIPHPDDDKSVEIQTYFNQHRNSMIYTKITLPVELYLITLPTIPKTIFSFISTSLFILKKWLPQCRIYYIDYTPDEPDDATTKNLSLIRTHMGSFEIERYN